MCECIESNLFKTHRWAASCCEICLSATCPFKATAGEIERRTWERIFPHFITYCDCVTYCPQGKMKDPAAIFFPPHFLQYTQNSSSVSHIFRSLPCTELTFQTPACMRSITLILEHASPPIHPPWRDSTE